MRIGVTGGSGFIGSYVVEEFLGRAEEVSVFDLTPPSIGRDVRWIEGDIRDRDSVHRFVSECDGLIHLAGVLGSAETVHNPYAAVTTNVLGGLNALESAARRSTPTILLGTGNHFMQNPYSISKASVERLGVMYNMYRGGLVSVVRAVNAYGPGQLPSEPFGGAQVRKVMPSFVARAISGLPIEIFFGGKQVSDLVWVGDVASAIVFSLYELSNRQEPLPRTVEVGPTSSTTIQEVADLVRRKCVDRGFPLVPIVDLGERVGETPDVDVVADGSTLELVGLHMDDLVGLESGVERTVDWFVETRGRLWDVSPKA